MTERISRHLWLLLVPVLLLAAALVLHRLDGFGFTDDEWHTLRLAGGRYHGPLSLPEVWERVSDLFPDQAYGAPLLYALWGKVFGWSEFGVRLLPFYAGLLALAWAYRAGRDMFAPQAGFIAAIFLATSAFFLVWMHVARAYSLVALFTVVTIWGYWRITRRISRRMTASGARHHAAARSGAAGYRIGQLCFLLGSIGIFYTHYFSVIILIALACWHLLFMPKDRNWRRPLWMLAIAAIVFLPELPGLLGGFEMTQTRYWFTEGMWRTSQILSLYVFVITNGILRIPAAPLSALPNLALLVLMSGALAWLWWRCRHKEWFRPARYVSFIFLFCLPLMLLINEILLIMAPDRLRYLTALWPLMALLVGYGAWKARGRGRLFSAALLGAIMVAGLWAQAFGNLRYEVLPALDRYQEHPLSAEIAQHAFQQDLLLISQQRQQAAREQGFRYPAFPETQLVIGETQPLAAGAIQDHLRILLLFGAADGPDHRERRAQLPAALVFCERLLERKNLVLELYTHTPTHCPQDGPPLMAFGEAGQQIALVAADAEILPTRTLRADLLLQAASAETMTAYSVALQVFELASGEKAAQGDRGLWLGRYNPIRSEIDISALPAGEYELRVGLYEWQTLAHLTGVDQRNGWRGEMLPLYRFEVK